MTGCGKLDAAGSPLTVGQQPATIAIGLTAGGMCVRSDLESQR